MDRKDIEETFARETGKTQYDEGRDSACSVGVMIIFFLIVAVATGSYAVKTLLF